MVAFPDSKIFSLKVRPGVSDLARAVFLALVYFFAAKLSLQLAFVHASATPVWPPTGIAMAALMIFGYKLLPGVFWGAFLANVTTEGTILTSLGIGAGNALEGLAGAYLANKFANGIKAFERPGSVFKFTVLAGMVATMVSPSFGVTSLLLGGFVDLGSYGPIWFTWWLGDAAGAIILTPALILWAKRFPITLGLGRLGELALLFAGILLTGFIAFGPLLPFKANDYPLEFLCIPPLVWAAFRFGPRESTAFTLALSGIAIWGTLSGYGPFARESPNESLLLLQTFTGIISIATLFFAATELERRRAERNLREEEKRFRLLIEKSYEAIVLVDSGGRVKYASPSTRRILGYDPSEFVGMQGFNLVHPEDRPRVEKAFADLAKEPGKSLSIECRTRRKDGETVWVQSTGTNLLDEPGIEAVVSNLRDITQHKKDEEELRISQTLIEQEIAKDEALLASIGDGVIAVDPKGRITFINEQAAAMLGWTWREAAGRSFFEVCIAQNESGEEVEEGARAMRRALTSGEKISTSEFYYLRKNKTRFPVSVSVSPIKDGEVEGAIMVFRDITEAKNIDRAKSEIISLASHQLRTPLTIISWCSKKLLTEDASKFSKSARQCLRDIRNGNQRMVELVDALLNVSRIELGTLQVKPEEIAFADISKDVLKELAPRIKKKQLTITEKYGKGKSGLKAVSDPNLIRIIFQNLISNAIKYTPPKGTVEILVHDVAAAIRIEVKDNGFGIPRDARGKIFTKLFRADNAKERDPEGTGLGLYLVRAVVEKLRGRVWFESEEHKGTTFYVELPSRAEA